MDVSRLLLAGCVAAIALMVIAPSARAENFHGTWFVVDGPNAGMTLQDVSPSGRVSLSKNEHSGAHGHVRPPNDECPYTHFDGFIGKKRIKSGDCLRILRIRDGTRLAQKLSAAIYDELVGDEQFVEHSQNRLEEANKLIPGLIASGVLSEEVGNRLSQELAEINDLDKRAEKDLKKDKDGKANKLIEKALKLKHTLFEGLPANAVVAQPPVVKPMEADFDQATFTTTYTVTATTVEDRVLRYSWSLVEHNDPNCVAFSGKDPAPNQARWYHPEGLCNHALEGPNGHVGTITALVTDGYYICAAFYEGSKTGVGPQPGPCSYVVDVAPF